MQGRLQGEARRIDLEHKTAGMEAYQNGILVSFEEQRTPLAADGAPGDGLRSESALKNLLLPGGLLSTKGQK